MFSSKVDLGFLLFILFSKDHPVILTCRDAQRPSTSLCAIAIRGEVKDLENYNSRSPRPLEDSLSTAFRQPFGSTFWRAVAQFQCWLSLSPHPKAVFPKFLSFPSSNGSLGDALASGMSVRETFQRLTYPDKLLSGPLSPSPVPHM